MLLTQPLTTFLSQNTSPQLPTLLLISPDGRLLSSSSPLPASLLRTQSTAACTLWNLYRPFERTSHLMHTALPQDPSSSALSNETATEEDIASMTVQLSQGTMVIRELSCGLIFVAIGPTATPTNRTASPLPGSYKLITPSIHSTPASPPSSPPAQTDGPGELGERVVSGGSLSATKSGTPSITGSIGSSVAGARQQASILKVKRQADEVGKWLEEKLQGFVWNSADGR